MRHESPSPLPQTVLRDLSTILAGYVKSGLMSSAKADVIMEQNVTQYVDSFPIYPVSLSGAIQTQAVIHASQHTQYEWLSKLARSSTSPLVTSLADKQSDDEWLYAEKAQHYIESRVMKSGHKGPSIPMLLSRNKSQSSRNAADQLSPWLLHILKQIVEWLDGQENISYAIRPIAHMHRVRLTGNLNYPTIDKVIDSSLPIAWAQTVMSAMVQDDLTGATLGVFPSTLPNLLVANAMNALPLFTTPPITSYWALDKIQQFAILGADGLADPESIKSLSSVPCSNLIRCAESVALVAAIVTVIISTLRLGSGIRKPSWLHTPMNHVNIKMLDPIWTLIRADDQQSKLQGDLV